MSPDGARWPSFEKLEECLKAWGRAEGDRLSVGVEGHSVQGRPLYTITLTDPDFPSEEKQHTVLSAVHAGGERSGAATLFGIMQWLLSEDPLATEVLRRQVIECMPIVHPDGYVQGRLGPQHSRHALIYNGWHMAGVTDPDAAPEAEALQRVVDRCRPDLYADVHGISLDFDGQFMLESSASSPNRLTSRPYHHQIARMMDQAALEGGFPSDFQEDDRELLYWDPSVEALGAKLWTGRGRWSPGLYAYARYHTLHVIAEIAWQRSGLLRFQRLLRIGNERWEGEHDPGYPNRVVGAFGPSGMYQMIVAYGKTAAQKRKSRVELWGKHHQLASALIDPQRSGKTAAVFALSSGARGQWLQGRQTADAFAANLQRRPGTDATRVADFLRGWPAGQNRPDPAFVVWPGSPSDAQTREDEPVRHGVAFRLRLPFAQTRIRELRLNGHPLPESDEDGYTTWRARGFTFIQVNVPPAKSRAEDLYVITCGYDPGEQRQHWEFSADHA